MGEGGVGLSPIEAERGEAQRSGLLSVAESVEFVRGKQA